jgi:uncharacterized protein (UPF0276 family)
VEAGAAVVAGAGAAVAEAAVKAPRGRKEAAMLANLPNLGVGLGFRAPFRSDLFSHQEQVDFLEITADHYMDASPEKERELDLLAAHFTLIPHGLNLSLGTAEGVDPVYLDKLAGLMDRLQPPWWSEHIAFTQAGGIHIGHLTPLPFTYEAVEVMCRNIATVRREIETPLLLENITYTVTLPGAEMTEPEFIAEVLERADCGLLLDVTNLYTNAINHSYDPGDFLNRLPLERVVQLHFAGGHWRGDLLVDSHAHPTPPEVWTWMEEVYARAPVKAAVLERDENLPPFEHLLAELEHARALRAVDVGE